MMISLLTIVVVALSIGRVDWSMMLMWMTGVVTSLISVIVPVRISTIAPTSMIRSVMTLRRIASLPNSWIARYSCRNWSIIAISVGCLLWK